MNAGDFNFIGKRIICQMTDGTKVDGILQGADEHAFYVNEDAGSFVQHKIIYKAHVTWIFCSEQKGSQAKENAPHSPIPAPSELGGLKVF